MNYGLQKQTFLPCQIRSDTWGDFKRQLVFRPGDYELKIAMWGKKE